MFQTVQCRGGLQRRKVKHEVTRQFAVGTLQRAVRCSAARKSVAKRRATVVQQAAAAASVAAALHSKGAAGSVIAQSMQRCWRGHAGRVTASKLRAVKQQQLQQQQLQQQQRTAAAVVVQGAARRLLYKQQLQQKQLQQAAFNSASSSSSSSSDATVTLQGPWKRTVLRLRTAATAAAAQARADAELLQQQLQQQALLQQQHSADRALQRRFSGVMKSLRAQMSLRAFDDSDLTALSTAVQPLIDSCDTPFRTATSTSVTMCTTAVGTSPRLLSPPPLHRQLCATAASATAATAATAAAETATAATNTSPQRAATSPMTSPNGASPRPLTEHSTATAAAAAAAAARYRLYYRMKLQYLTAQEVAHGSAVRSIQAAVRGFTARAKFAPLLRAHRQAVAAAAEAAAAAQAAAALQAAVEAEEARHLEVVRTAQRAQAALQLQAWWR
jgi:trimeric autotransporter adhesin